MGNLAEEVADRAGRPGEPWAPLAHPWCIKSARDWSLRLDRIAELRRIVISWTWRLRKITCQPIRVNGPSVCNSHCQRMSSPQSKTFDSTPECQAWLLRFEN